ncbi:MULTISPECIES: hypothetical protein [Streptomyces]|uniref:hypothetical protein n=1 Tax=Streptomyces TaxID=1883 RepID=UPI00067D892B|nr:MULTISPECIES: hypothetical protein [unclassified Streptomyces]MDX3606722.1 hypothetical protein [Streptomyces sp. FL06-04B]MDX3739054.1 hypothetical protein [Streptomyces sp. ID01-15D]
MATSGPGSSPRPASSKSSTASGSPRPPARLRRQPQREEPGREVPERWEVLDALPRNETLRKVPTYRLRERFGG